MAGRTTKTVAKNVETKVAKKVAKKAPWKPGLLSGGNPQIPKGEGDAPVQAWIATVPAARRDLARQVDAVVERAVPKVRKAVKWNSPLYGVAGDGWFLSLHVFTHYLKVTFFRGTSLEPMPPGTSKHKDVRYLDLRDAAPFDAAQFTRWVKQASRLPGEKM